MGVDTTNWTVQDYISNAPAVGLPASLFATKYQSLAAGLAASSVPSGAPKTFVTACTGSLIIRGILYFKNNPGDCGSPTQLNITDAQITQDAGGLASVGVKIGTQVAGVASMAGAILPGIGVAVSLLTQIFANHAAAVANEQSTICSVANLINRVIPTYDSAVMRGLISPQAAYTGMQTYLNQVIEQLDGIVKTCNAACVYIAILNAHAQFVEKYYPLIAPPSIAPQAPGQAPVTQTAPGQPPVNGGAPTVSPIVPQPTAVDYFGQNVEVGASFFSTAEAITILPGVTGDYFTNAALAGRNQWGLTATSPISDGQYAQLVSLGAIPLKRAQATSTVLGLNSQTLLFAAIALFALLIATGKVKL